MVKDCHIRQTSSKFQQKEVRDLKVYLLRNSSGTVLLDSFEKTSINDVVGERKKKEGGNVEKEKKERRNERKKEGRKEKKIRKEK